MTWDVRTPSGVLVKTLGGLARALDTSPTDAAYALLADPGMAARAPRGLVSEAKAAAKPGDGTPPPITNGSFVSWSGGKGRVDLIVRSGKVPGVSGDVEATSDSPAARIVVWKGDKPTREKVAASTHTLKRIAPLDGSEGKAMDVASTLVALVTEQNARVDTMRLPEFRKVTGASVKAAYTRGLDAYPEGRTDLTREEWALGRAQHFVKVANGVVATRSNAGHDTDLLHKSHPLNPDQVAEPPRAEVVLDVSDVERRIAALRA